MTPANLPPSATVAYQQLVEGPDSPRWTHRKEDRLTAAMRREVTAFAVQVAQDPPGWQAGEEPAWLRPWLEAVWSRTPAHAGRGPLPPRLVDIAPLSRDDLARGPWRFVPQDVALEELIAHDTSGTAGRPTTVPSHPVTTASYYPLVLAAARPAVLVTPRPDRLDWVTVISQEAGGYVIPSWSSVLGCLTAQVNLRPHAWTAPDHAAAFLAGHDPQVITGDPVAFDDLLDLDPDIRPRLLVSTAAALSDGMRRRLEERFGAVVLEVYALTEAGPVAAATSPGGRLHLVQPRLFVEVLRPDGSPADPGERGEVTLTGGMNRVLPLVRYRTGDHAALQWGAGARVPTLIDLDGRTPVVFRAVGGGRVNSHSINVALRPLALPRFTLHQAADGALTFGADPLDEPQRRSAHRVLIELFGDDVEVTWAPLPAGRGAGGKVVPFSVTDPGA